MRVSKGLGHMILYIVKCQFNEIDLSNERRLDRDDCVTKSFQLTPKIVH